MVLPRKPIIPGYPMMISPAPIIYRNAFVVNEVPNFGALSLLWSVISIALTILYWHGEIAHLLQRRGADIALYAIGGLLLAVLAVRLGRSLRARRGQRKQEDRELDAAGSADGGSV
jgi:hypothetical protein